MSRRLKPKDLDAYSEVSLALAQATMQQAIDASGLDKSTVAMRFCDSPRRRWAAGHLKRLLSGDCDLTVRDLGRLLAICGFEVRFSRIPRVKTPKSRTLAEVKKLMEIADPPGLTSSLKNLNALLLQMAPYTCYKPSWLRKGAKIRYLGCRNGSDDVFVVGTVGRASRTKPAWFVARRRDPVAGQAKTVVVSCTPEVMRSWQKHEGD